MFNPETFAAFRYRDFRVLWTATFVRSAALALELVARAVLIVELSGSAVLLGAVLAAWMAPNLLLSPFAGVIVDRYPYRRVLIGSFLANAVASGVLFVLLIGDQAQSWQVISLSALSGIGFVFFNLARRALLPVIVESSHLRSATALSQTGQTSVKIGGALLAGLLLSIADFTWMFGLMTAFSLLAALLGARIQTRQQRRSDGDVEVHSILGQITAGARWAIETRWPIAVLVITAMSYMFLQPYEAVLMPLVVIDELGQHRSWVGYLAAVGGLGATVGAVWLASLKQIRSPNLLMVGLIATGGASLIGIALAPHLAVAAVCVFFATACVYNMATVANLALLAHAPEEMRGQALTLMNLVQGTILIGALIAGALVDSLGPQGGLLTMAACLLGASLLALSMPRVRWWLWRRRMYTDLTAADWMRASEGDR
ncbi:MAG: MFS transporter [Chloroflexota bacterium]|nr:MFS transporter [Chloroflexota bacterium]MDE2894209.1 MFS transporter [Chloroflexota bacterium]